MDQAFDPWQFLRDQGVPEDLIDQAVEENWLTMLVLERWLLPGERSYTHREIAEATGVDLDHAGALWRALGFPEVPDDLSMFTEQDREILELGALRLAEGDSPERHVTQLRAISAGMSRVAELLSDELIRFRDDGRDMGIDDETMAAHVPDRVELETIGRVMDYVLRRQLTASLWRRVATRLQGGDEVAVTVGFADLVGYTALSQELTATELTELVVWFEGVTSDLITAAGGRVVKRIGDAVMFSMTDPRVAVTVSLDLIDAVAAKGQVLRVGLAHGPVVGHEGDLFGTPVNLASRLQTMARPGRVVINEDVHDALGELPGVHVRPLGRRRVKDLGSQRIWRLRRDESAESGQAAMFGESHDAPALAEKATTLSKAAKASRSDEAATDPTVVYTDGACSGNPGPGGWAWASTQGPWASGVENPSTNQRMEVVAAHEAVKANPGPLVVVSDSTYVVKCFNDGWWKGWRKRGWKNSKREPVANRDLWEPFIELVLERGDVTFQWVKGHSDDPMNDLVDALAVRAAEERRGRSGDRPPSGV